MLPSYNIILSSGYTAAVRLLTCLSLGLLVACAVGPRPTPAPSASAAAAREAVPREEDEYTRYELLDPDTHRFHILFEVTAVTPGATTYFNPIRKGSTASGEAEIGRAHV